MFDKSSKMKHFKRKNRQSKSPANAVFTGLFFMEPFVGLEPTTC